MIELLLFEIEHQHFAIDIHAVHSVIHVVTITPLPEAPPFIMGAINVHGEVVSVVNMRKIMKLPEHELSLSDQMVICQVDQKPAALYVDKTIGVFSFAESELSPALTTAPDSQSIDAVIKQEDKLIFVYNPKKLLEAVLHE